MNEDILGMYESEYHEIVTKKQAIDVMKSLTAKMIPSLIHTVPDWVFEFSLL